MNSLMDCYTKEEFNQILQISKSYSDFCKKLGYQAISGDLVKKIKEKIQQLNLSDAHFTQKTSQVKRTFEDVFIENSTVNQSTLRKWYLKGKYSDYKCSICGQEPIWQNQPLTLILDHINGKNHDNRLENLRWVCPNCNQQLPTTNGKNIIRKNNKKLYYCQDCGIQVSGPNVKHCVKCAVKYNPSNISKVKPSREILKELIYTQTFRSIGKQYGVSDNAIKKWCKSYNLPYKKSDIKLFTQEEWQKI